MKDVCKHYRNLLKALWEDNKVTDTNTDFEEYEDYEKWLFLAVKYAMNPALWRKRLMEQFAANKRYFHGYYQGSTVFDRYFMESICLINKVSAEIGDVGVYQECIVYYNMFCALYSRFKCYGDYHIYIPGNYSHGLDIVREFNLTLLTTINVSNLKTAGYVPKGHTLENYLEKDEGSLSSKMIISLKDRGILPAIQTSTSYFPALRDEITLVTYGQGKIAYCSTLTGSGCPQWLAGYNNNNAYTNKDKHPIFLNWVTEDIPIKTAQVYNPDNKAMLMPVADVEKAVEQIAEELGLGDNVISEVVFGSEYRAIPATSVQIPEISNKYHALYDMEPSNFFDVGRFQKYFNLNGRDLRDGAVAWILQNTHIEGVKEMADALLAEKSGVQPAA